ncbi:nuclease-related domain-containing protein [Streptomyces sp. NPDC029526]|uniref:nuclease-related domain-containing protein n=1 Tax=Streptomyces sp. NPDC029526 TaxID=3155728 RepID=UPI0033F185F2
MERLRVIPVRQHGRQRLHVCRPDGGHLASYDPEEGRVDLRGADHEEAVLTALRPFLTGPVSVGPPPVPPPAELARLSLHPDDDLAPNRPGEALLVALDRAPRRAHRRFRVDPRRAALDAERTVGEALDRLEDAGWHTLHSVPLPGGDRVHHLLIGPGGLYAVHTLDARRQRVSVVDPRVAVGRREARPLLHRVRADASRASYALTSEVRAVLVVVGASRLTVPAVPRGVRVLADGDLADLARPDGVLKPADVEALHTMARDRCTWLRV